MYISRRKREAVAGAGEEEAAGGQSDWCERCASQVPAGSASAAGYRNNTMGCAGVEPTACRLNVRLL